MINGETMVNTPSKDILFDKLDVKKSSSPSAIESLYKRYESLPPLQQIALGVAPGTGEAISAWEAPIFAGEAKEAFDKGKYLEAAGKGGLATLSALGAIPGLGLGIRAIKGGAKAATKIDEIGEGLSSILKSEKELKNYGDIWKDSNRLPVNQRQAQDPIVKQAAQDLDSGKIKGKQFRDIVKEVLPIKPIDEMVDVPTFDEIAGALKKDQVIKGIVGVNKAIPEGTRLATRLDIPAYNSYNKWIVSIHEGLKGGSVGYSKSARLKDVVFGSSPRTSLDIASEKLKPNMDKIRAAKKAFEKKFNRKPNKKEADQIRKDPKNLKKQDKATIARMEGNWTNTPDEDTISFAERLLKNKKDGKYIDDVGEEWVQVGMNPYRGSYFYDKATGQALQAADELIQVGPLVFAKGARKPTLSEYKKGFTTTTESTSKKPRRMEKDEGVDLPTNTKNERGILSSDAVRIKEDSIIPEDIIGTFDISDDAGRALINPKSFQKKFPNMTGDDQIDSFRKYKAKQLKELGDEPNAFYHVTSKKNIPSIFKKGLLKKNKSKGGLGQLLQKDEGISVFNNPEDAVQWAQKISQIKEDKVFPVILKIAKDKTVKKKVAFKEGGQIMPMQYGGGLDDAYMNRRRSSAFAAPNATSAFASPMSMGGLPTIYRSTGSGISDEDMAAMAAELDQADFDAGAASLADDAPDYGTLDETGIPSQAASIAADKINAQVFANYNRGNLDLLSQGAYNALIGTGLNDGQIANLTSQQLSNFQNAYDGKSLGGDLGADDFSKGWRYGGARGTIQDILEKGAIDQLGLKDFFEELNEKKSTKKKEGIEDLIGKGIDMFSLTKNMTPESITSLNNMLANKNFEFTPNNKFASGVVSAFTPLSAKLGMSLLGGEKTVGTITNKETGTSYQVGDRGGLTLNTPDPTVDYGSDAEIKEEEKEVVTKKTPEEVKEETKVEIEKEPRVDPNVKIIMDIYNMTEDEANRFLGNEGVGTGGAGEFEGI